MVTKQITIRAYTSGGVFIKHITDSEFTSFSKYINGGLGNLTLKLARKLDTFNSASDVSFGNIIKIYISDEDADDVLIYSGTIEEQKPSLDGTSEYVEIVCYGYATKLKNDILRISSTTTIATNTSAYLTTGVASSVAEIANVVKKIIDNFNLSTDNSVYNISYSNDGGISSIATTSTAINYKFEAMQYYDAIEACRQIAPTNFYWFLDADGKFYFQSKASTATHTFVVGKNIKSIEVSKSLQQVKNILLLWDGNTGGNYRKYQDAISVSLYGRRVKHVIDSGLEDTATMDSLGNSFINENKDPFIRVEVVIYDNNNNTQGYNIESIKPGDTCKITNIDDSSEIFNNNMMITEIEWSLDSARVIIDINEFDITRFLTSLKKESDENQTESIISAYTTVT